MIAERDRTETFRILIITFTRFWKHCHVGLPPRDRRILEREGCVIQPDHVPQYRIRELLQHYWFDLVGSTGLVTLGGSERRLEPAELRVGVFDDVVPPFVVAKLHPPHPIRCRKVGYLESICRRSHLLTHVNLQ